MFASCNRPCALFTTCNYDVGISSAVAIFISSLLLLFIILSTKRDRNCTKHNKRYVCEIAIYVRVDAYFNMISVNST